jgi:hypothetical protein
MSLEGVGAAASELITVSNTEDMVADGCGVVVVWIAG